MNEIDSKILIICKSKRKIKRIRTLLSKITLGDGEEFYNVPSLSKPEVYQVFLTNNGFKCNCIYNYRFKKYMEGMKRHKLVDECIHILAIKAFIFIKQLP